MARYAAGAGFAGVYSVSAGSFFLCPSGDTIYADGTVPDPRVDRRGGHAVVEAILGRCVADGGSGNVGFAVEVLADGSLTVCFRSSIVNLPRYDDYDAPEVFEGRAVHRPVVAALVASFGRPVVVVTLPRRL